jgi:peptide/nickel transport system substrate-binding protein
MNRNATAFAGIAAIGVGALLLAGCAATPEGGGDTPSTEQLPLVGYEDVAYDDLADGGNLSLAVTSSPTAEGSWNPQHANAANVDVQAVLDPTLGTPIKAEADGSWSVNTNYAESVELTSEDPQVVTVKLNKNAKWEDGSPMTAADYQSTFHALSGQDDAYNIASSAGFEQVTSFDIANDYEFSFTVSPVYADWPNILNAAILPKAIADDPDAWNSGYVDKPTPSNGPYKFTSVDSSANVFVAEPNPQWWGDKPKLDKITFTVIDQETQAQSFANDEIDAVELSTPDAYLSAQDKKGAEVLRSGGLTYSQVTFNGTVAPLDDPAVRQAIAHGINRDIMGKAANEPLGAPSSPVGNYVLMPGQDGYTDTTGDALAYDPEKAKQILTDDGWVNADGKWTKDGTDLTVSVK